MTVPHEHAASAKMDQGSHKRIIKMENNLLLGVPDGVATGPRGATASLVRIYRPETVTSQERRSQFRATNGEIAGFWPEMFELIGRVCAEKGPVCGKNGSPITFTGRNQQDTGRNNPARTGSTRRRIEFGTNTE